jgi:hypothetical protein
LAAELGTFHDGMADPGKHFPEPETHLTMIDLLGARSHIHASTDIHAWNVSGGHTF